MEIVQMGEVTDELLEALARLVPQLAPLSPPPTRAQLEAVVGTPGTVLLAAREGPGGAILGSLTLVSYALPSGPRVWIEDVVVDEAARGRGVGEALVRAALERAREMGAPKVDLTSRPAREAANRLYRRLGFELRDTNAYRYDLHP